MSGTILVDSGNHPEFHPEIAELEQRFGLTCLQVALPVGDYAAVTQRYIDIVKSSAVEKKVLAKCKHVTKEVKTRKIDVAGTYSVGVDTKANLGELYACLILIDERYRFERELIRARNLGIHLHVLTVGDEKAIASYTSVGGYADAGKRMLDRMRELQEMYPVTFEFCRQEDLAGCIRTLLKLEPLLRQPVHSK